MTETNRAHAQYKCLDSREAGERLVQRGSPYLNLGRLSIAALLGDLVVLIAAYIQVTAGLYIDSPDVPRALAAVLALVLTWLPVSISFGIYQRGAIVDSLAAMYLATKTTVVTGAVFHLIPLVGGSVLSKVAAMGTVGAMALGVACWRLLLSRIAPTVDIPRPLIIVGAGWAGQVLARAVGSRPSCGVSVLALVEESSTQGIRITEGVPVHPLEAMPDLVRATQGRAIVVFAMQAQAPARLYEELTALTEAGIEVAPMSVIYEQVTGCIPVFHLGTTWWVNLPKAAGSTMYLVAKRLLDIGLALLGLVVFLSVLPLIAIPLKLEGLGSLFFSQKRIGEHGKLIEIVKLRTLKSPDEGPDYWLRKSSNQASRLGSLLRATGFDELPQCLNVLKGEMSVVGPRPYVPEEVADLQQRIPFFRMRLLVHPGITGWAQVNCGYGLSLEEEVEKLQYDLFYVARRSFYLDIAIIVRTVHRLLRKPRGANQAAIRQPSRTSAGR